MTQTLMTSSGARLHLIQKTDGSLINWVFVPGGPGIGSESLQKLTDSIPLPGKVWHFDFPGDGSNRIVGGKPNIQIWKNALVEAVETLEPSILVAHSFGGMLVLATPVLQKNIKGLILISSAPSKKWMDEFNNYRISHPVKGLSQLQADFDKSVSNNDLKAVTLSSASYFFCQKSLQEGIKTLENLPYNAEAFLLAKNEFHSNFQALCVPDSIPTLIIGDSEDHLTPLDLFENSPEFQRNNIQIARISGGSHFPWIEERDAIVLLLQGFVRQIYI